MRVPQARGRSLAGLRHWRRQGDGGLAEATDGPGGETYGCAWQGAIVWLDAKAVLRFQYGPRERARLAFECWSRWRERRISLKKLVTAISSPFLTGGRETRCTSLLDPDLQPVTQKIVCR